MDTERPAPTMAAATAIVIIVPESRSSMMVSPCFAVLLQRILLNAHKIRGIVFRRRIGTSSLRKGEVFHPRRQHHRRERVVSLDAARLVINSVFLLALPGELLLDDPGPRPHGRIFDRDDVF